MRSPFSAALTIRACPQRGTYPKTRRRKSAANNTISYERKASILFTFTYQGTGYWRFSIVIYGWLFLPCSPLLVFRSLETPGVSHRNPRGFYSYLQGFRGETPGVSKEDFCFHARAHYASVYMRTCLRAHARSRVLASARMQARMRFKTGQLQVK